MHGRMLPSKMILMVTRRFRIVKALVRAAIAGVAFALSTAPAAAGNEEAVRRCQELMPAFVKAPSRLDIVFSGSDSFTVKA